jgi:hypothetical protein
MELVPATRQYEPACSRPSGSPRGFARLEGLVRAQRYRAFLPTADRASLALDAVLVRAASIRTVCLRLRRKPPARD